MAANNEEDEDDYMSDKFLHSNDNVRPGLLFSRASQKKFEQELKHKRSNEQNRTKPKGALEEERRNEGLASALPTENKGFAMMQKMGYKPGMAIGKKGVGKTEPIDINIKGDRGGLGRDTQIKRHLEEKMLRMENWRKKRLKREEDDEKSFRTQLSSKLAERQILGDLRKSQKTCQYLDNQENVFEPVQDWFWLKNDEDDEEEEKKKEKIDKEETLQDEDSDEDEDEDEGDEPPPEFMLEKLTEYLRTNHKYCIWCGIKFDDEDDMKTNCPGNTADDH